MPRHGTSWKEAGWDESLTDEDRAARQSDVTAKRIALEKEYGRRMAVWNGWKQDGSVVYKVAPHRYLIGSLVLVAEDIDLMDDNLWAKLIMAVVTLPK